MKPTKYPGIFFEKQLWKKGNTLIAGIDEAGRGAWAGPVVAAAVILPPKKNILKTLYGVRDSKQMSPHQRDFWELRINECALSWAVGYASRMEIDAMGILPATRLAMSRAIESLDNRPQHLLIDAVKLEDMDIPQTSLIKGDCLVLSIASASILAKTARDAWMRKLDQRFPEYGFLSHKGYGTSKHQQSLSIHGPCVEHRTSYAPISRLLKVEKSHG